MVKIWTFIQPKIYTFFFPLSKVEKWRLLIWIYITDILKSSPGGFSIRVSGYATLYSASCHALCFVRWSVCIRENENLDLAGEKEKSCDSKISETN